MAIDADIWLIEMQNEINQGDVTGHPSLPLIISDWPLKQTQSMNQPINE